MLLQIVSVLKYFWCGSYMLETLPLKTKTLMRYFKSLVWTAIVGMFITKYILKHYILKGCRVNFVVLLPCYLLSLEIPTEWPPMLKKLTTSKVKPLNQHLPQINRCGIAETIQMGMSPTRNVPFLSGSRVVSINRLRGRRIYLMTTVFIKVILWGQVRVKNKVFLEQYLNNTLCFNSYFVRS